MAGSNPRVEVFILCYNRVDFVGPAIRSIENQDYPNLKVIVSDNSPRDEVSEYLTREFPQLEVRRRIPSQTPYDHLNTVFGEATAPYFMVFHDDDLLLPSAIRELVNILESDPSLSAAAGNARILRDHEETEKRFNATLAEDKVFREPAALARQYLDHSLGVNPFPGYLYRRTAAQSIRFNTQEAGQYSDLTYLVKLASQGPIYWKAEPLMLYRKHSGNASGAISLRATKQAVQFLIRQGVFSADAPELKEFRYWNHLFYLRNKRRGGQRLSPGHLALVLNYFARHPMPLVRKVLQKLRSK